MGLLLNFLFKRPKVENREKNLSRVQRQLENFQRLPPEKEKPLPTWASSIKEIENEANNQLKVFQSYIKEIKDASLRLEELTKMLKSGEISENIYNLLLDELSNNLSVAIEEIFKIRGTLEILRARSKIEWAKEKINMLPESYKETYRMLGEDFYKELYSPLYRWQEIINRIDAALSSLAFEEELAIIERYLTIIREGASQARPKEILETKQTCQQRLNMLSEKWASIRRDKIGKIMDLELKASQLEDEVKELEVRFAVGDMDRYLYESKISVLQGSLKKIEKEISEIRNYIDEIDLKIFRASELLRENI